VELEASRVQTFAVSTAVPVVFTIAAVVGIAASQGGYFPTSWGWSALALAGVVGTWAVAAGETDGGRLDAAFLLALLALTAWVGLSIAWSRDPAQSVLELERWLVLLAGCTAFLLLARRGSQRAVSIALVVAIASVGVYSLGSRLFPGRIGAYDPVAGYRLSAPVGYWNALGVFAVVGILLALGLAVDAEAHLLARALGAAAVTLLPLVVYFTFSRASWIALAFGFAIAFAVSPDRLRLATEAAVFAVLSVPSVLLASQSSSLASRSSSLSAAASQGHRLAALAAATAVVSALAVAALAAAEKRIRLPQLGRRLYAVALIGLPAAVALAVIVSYGGPQDVATRAYDAFASAPPTTDPNDLNSRLFSLNGNGRVELWRVAVQADHGHWLGGTGAGSFERVWDQSPRADAVVRDAHSLYVETLSELGVVGLCLLALLLGVPVVAALRARRSPLVPAALGAYVAFLLHNAVDWDWELSGVALTGLYAGSLLLLPRRPAAERRLHAPARAAGAAGAALVGAFAVVVAIGNGALAHATTANERHDYAAAASQARLARRWMPWSPAPLLALGRAELGHGDPRAATATFRHAVSIDRRSWLAWLDLAASTSGAERRRAIVKARALYPRSPEIAAFLDELRSS
jgi:O-Antigen ligase